ncbi:MFS transporter [Ruegeria jejuensis]|uniref:MFS transporter n=1 Tax=Ruegeria jejuensis TaxID=3233338 RepID=UPI00355B548C
MAVISLSGFLTGFDYTALTIAIPKLGQEFQSTYSITSWVLLAYALIFASFAMPAGNLIRIFGGRKLLMAGFLIYAVSSVCCTLAPGILSLALFRALQAIGGVILFVSGPALVRLHMGEDARGLGYGIAALAPTIGIFSGPALGALILSELSWRWIFVVNLPVCLVGISIVALMSPLRASNVGKKQFDIPGSLMLLSGLGLLVFALNRGTELGWASHYILIAFAISAINLVVFAVWELRSARAAFELRLLKVAVFRNGAFAIFLYLFLYGGLSFSFPIFLNQIKDVDIATVGWIMSVQPMTILATTFGVGTIAAVLSSGWRAGIGVALIVASMALALQDHRATGLWLVSLVLFALGLAQTLFLPAMLERSLEPIKQERAAQATGVLTTLRTMGQLFGVVVFETILSSRVGADNTQVTPTHGDHLSFLSLFWLAMLVALLAGVCVLAQNVGRPKSLSPEL